MSERLALMDDMGVSPQVVYPNGIGFASNHIFAIEDEAQRTAVLQIYNDFYVDIQDESGGRLVPQAMLPIWDMDLTVAEMTRLLDKGIRGFTLSDKPELLGLPELPEPYFEPMWDLFNESGAVVNFHIGAGQRKEEMEAIRAARYTKIDQDAFVNEARTSCRPVLAIVRPSAPPRGRRHPDLHEQRPHHRQPVHERRVRPVPEACRSSRPRAASGGFRSSSSRWSSSSTRW